MDIQFPVTASVMIVSAFATVALGYRCRSAAVPDAPQDGPAALLPRELAGQSGTRAPHMPVRLDGELRSSLDLYGREWVLLAGPDGAGWVEAAEQVRRAPGIPARACRFGVELVAADGPARHGLGAGGALLVRPDGLVAWRAPSRLADPGRAPAEALGTVLARNGRVAA